MANKSQSLLRETAQFAIQEKQKADDFATIQAHEKALRLKNQLEWDPKSGALLTQGQNSFGIIDNYVPQFEKGLQEISDGLANPEQRAIFSGIRTKMQAEFTDGLNRHIGRETIQFQNQQTKASIEAIANDAVLNSYTPGRVDEGIQLKNAVLQRYAQTAGTSPEELKVQIDESTSALNRGVIEKYVNDGNVSLAQMRYKQVRPNDGLTAKDDEYLKNLMRAGNIRGESQYMADSITAKGLSQTDAIAEVKKIKDPELRDATMQRVKQDYRDIENARDEDYKNSFQDAFNKASKANDPDAIPETTWVNIKPQDQKLILDYTGLRRNGAVIETRPIVKNSIMQALANPVTRSEAARYDLTKESLNLSDGDMRDLQELQQGIINNDEKAQKRIDQYVTNDSLMKATLKEAGIDAKKKPADYAIFMESLQRRIDRMTEEKGRYPSNDEIQHEVDNLILKSTERGLIFDSHKKVYQVNPRDVVFIEYENIPEEERITIENGLRERNVKVTEEEVEKRYNNYLNKHR